MMGTGGPAPPPGFSSAFPALSLYLSSGVPVTWLIISGGPPPHRRTKPEKGRGINTTTLEP